jgi:hypothetical protein
MNKYLPSTPTREASGDLASNFVFECLHGVKTFVRRSPSHTSTDLLHQVALKMFSKGESQSALSQVRACKGAARYPFISELAYYLLARAHLHPLASSCHGPDIMNKVS